LLERVEAIGVSFAPAVLGGPAFALLKGEHLERRVAGPAIERDQTTGRRHLYATAPLLALLQRVEAVAITLASPVDLGDALAPFEGEYGKGRVARTLHERQLANVGGTSATGAARSADGPASADA
jgi:hypothetical protein